MFGEEKSAVQSKKAGLLALRFHSSREMYGKDAGSRSPIVLAALASPWWGGNRWLPSLKESWLTKVNAALRQSGCPN